MSTNIAPWSLHGTPSDNLNGLLQRAAPESVQVTNFQCDESIGLSRCMHPLGRPYFFGISNLDSGSAACQQFAQDHDGDDGHFAQGTYLQRFTGQCQLTNPSGVGAFLVECKSSTEDYIIVSYGSSQSILNAYGGARALFSYTFNGAIDQFKQWQTSDDPRQDVYIWCPNHD